MRSAWRSNGACCRSSPVSGSKGGKPDTNTMFPARVQTETGAPHFSKLVSNGSTRMIRVAFLRSHESRVNFPVASSGDARRATGGDDVSASDLPDERAAGLPGDRER